MATKKTTPKTTPAPVTAKSPSAAAAAPALAAKSSPGKRVASSVPVAKKLPANSTVKTKKAAAVAVQPKVSDLVLEDEIRAEAYSYFIQRGYRPGDPVADWHRAEDAVLRRFGLR